MYWSPWNTRSNLRLLTCAQKSRNFKRLFFDPAQRTCPGGTFSIHRLQSLPTRYSRSWEFQTMMRGPVDLKKEAVPSSTAKEGVLHVNEPLFAPIPKTSERVIKQQMDSRTRAEGDCRPLPVSQESDINGLDTKVDIIQLKDELASISAGPVLEVKDELASISAAPVLQVKSENRLARHISEGSHEQKLPFMREQNYMRRAVTEDVGLSPSKRQHSVRDDVGHAAPETFLLTRLIFSLLRYLRVGYRWVVTLMGLWLYAIFLMPGFLQVGYQYFFSKHVRRGIVYGAQRRNRLDLYMPENAGTDSSDLKPVLIFVTGGAWIIGYRAWGSLLGLQFLERDIMVCSVDYRNFPRGHISDMVEDVSTGIGFIINNIDQYGGDPNRIYLAGQSAGSHIAACTLIEQARREIGQKEGIMTWNPGQIKAFLGISGGYNLPKLVDHFHKRCFFDSIFLSVMEGKTSLPLYSPELAVRSESFAMAIPKLPPIHLFHGTADYSILCEASTDFGDALRAAGATAITKLYEEKTHTDFFLQDPMRGGYDVLFEDLVAVIHADDVEAKARDAKALPRPRLVPEFLLQLARAVCPF